MAHNARVATKRDFILIPDVLVPLVRSCEIPSAQGFDVHCPVVLRLGRWCNRPFRALAQPHIFACPEQVSVGTWRDMFEQRAQHTFALARGALDAAVSEHDMT
eukprot:9173456-Alexandrium_andersonii.AAC.1